MYGTFAHLFTGKMVGALAFSGLSAYLLRGKEPWTWSLREDHCAEASKTVYQD